MMASVASKSRNGSGGERSSYRGRQAILEALEEYADEVEAAYTLYNFINTKTNIPKYVSSVIDDRIRGHTGSYLKWRCENRMINVSID